MENIKLISDINDIALSIELGDLENDNNIILIKYNIIDNLFDIIKELLTNLFIKYQISLFEVDKFIKKIKEIKNKYNMIDEFLNFISILKI
jgi:hypothetical protein